MKKIKLYSIYSIIITIKFIFLFNSLFANLSDYPFKKNVNYFEYHQPLNVTNSANHSIFYHTNIVDHLWYGTDRWAVRFDIPAYSSVVDSFSLQSIEIFLPDYDYSRQSRQETTVSVYTDVQQPLTQPAYTTSFQSEFGWNTIDLSEDDYLVSDVYWVVIDYQTNSSDTFIAGSVGSGNHSYYWVPPTPDGNIPGHFANMAENNASSELIVNISGVLFFDGIHITVDNLWFEGDFEPGGEVYPVTVISNNSELLVDEVTIKVRLQNNLNEFPEERIVNYPVNLGPGSSETLILNTFEFAFDLPEYRSQYTGRLTLEHPDEGFSANNSMVYNFDNYDNDFRKIIIENFLVSNHSASDNVQSAQNYLSSDQDILILNYYLNQNDDYFHNVSLTRSEFYSIYGYPFTVINGLDKIAGYNNSYSDSLSHLLSTATDYNTFIEVGELLKYYNSRDEFLRLDFFLVNNETQVFNQYINDLRMHFFVLQQNIPGVNGKVILDYQLIDRALAVNYGQHDEFMFTIQLLALNPYNDVDFSQFEDFSVLYFVQHRNNKKIYYLDWHRFDEFSEDTSTDSYHSIDDRPLLRISPNPVRDFQDIQICFTTERTQLPESVKIELYNIKGQKICSYNLSENEISSSITFSLDKVLPETQANGIYLLRVKGRKAGRVELDSFNKVLILR